MVLPPAYMQAGPRRNDDEGGFLGGLFPTCLPQAGAALPRLGLR